MAKAKLILIILLLFIFLIYNKHNTYILSHKRSKKINKKQYFS